MAARGTPTYIVKGRQGDVLVEGDAAAVRKWLTEERITSKAEMRRRGVLLYEDDEAWAILEAFPEFAGPSAFEAVSRRARLGNWALAAAAVLALIGLGLLWISQGYPRYDASRQIEAAKEAQSSAEAAAAASRKAALQAQAAEFSAREAQARAEEQARTTANSQRRLIGEFEAYRRRLPVYVEWREAVFGKYSVMTVHNLSSEPLDLLVSVWGKDGVQTRRQFPMKVAPYAQAGFKQETGRGETVSHEFAPGEVAELTDVGQAKQEQYRPSKFTCPR
jgi:hypothetical protein